MDQRLEFVRLARLNGSNRWELCRRFGIGPGNGPRTQGNRVKEQTANPILESGLFGLA